MGAVGRGVMKWPPGFRAAWWGSGVCARGWAIPLPSLPRSSICPSERHGSVYFLQKLSG